MILMISVGVFSYVRVTYSDFNGITGKLDVFVTVTYSSNYPESLNIPDSVSIYTDTINSTYFIEKNMFNVPKGYVFHSWNTKSDGSGTLYKEGKYHSLSESMNLYGIWGKRILGDVNLDGIIDNNDIVRLNKYITDTSYLFGVILSNSDVNLDGKVDKIDADIIKHAILGTEGYTTLLENEPVFIFDLYGSKNNNGGGTGTGGASGDENNSSSGDGSQEFDDDYDWDRENGAHDDDKNSFDNMYDNNLNNDEYDKVDGTKKNKSYIWYLIIGIILISLRVSIDVLKKFKDKISSN